MWVGAYYDLRSRIVHGWNLQDIEQAEGDAAMNEAGAFARRKIEALFMALGAVKDEGQGSSVTFILNDKRADFHRPHPNRNALRYRVKAAREFLEKAGIKP